MKSIDPSSASLGKFFVTAFIGFAAIAHAESQAPKDDGVYFCPVKITASGERTDAIFCDAEHCYVSGSPELTAAQRSFLDSSKGACRHLSNEEISSFWPKQTPEMVVTKAGAK